MRDLLSLIILVEYTNHHVGRRFKSVAVDDQTENRPRAQTDRALSRWQSADKTEPVCETVALQNENAYAVRPVVRLPQEPRL